MLAEQNKQTLSLEEARRAGLVVPGNATEVKEISVQDGNGPWRKVPVRAVSVTDYATHGPNAQPETVLYPITGHQV